MIGARVPAVSMQTSMQAQKELVQQAEAALRHTLEPMLEDEGTEEKAVPSLLAMPKETTMVPREEAQTAAETLGAWVAMMMATEMMEARGQMAAKPTFLRSLPTMMD